MSAEYRLYNVKLSKRTVSTGERFIIQVDIIDWDWIKKNIATWNTLKTNFAKWGDLIGN